MTTNNNFELVQQVQAFLFKEARLMDTNSYQPWLDLWHKEKCTYWIPANDENSDPSKHVSILYYDRGMLDNHIIRLIEGKAFAQNPKSKTLRSVTNVEATQDGDIVTANANFLVTELRGHVQSLFAGRSEYTLQENTDSYIIKTKKVILLKLDEPQDNVTFLL
ncbi:MAG: aromatic-ring-hydroxylating dioxygenase subunit beta [Pseudomonadales bacterium]|nr:aromatic-ring-hydroxylating dioxygenase subunit beta [Pseudomonadales bacterium]